MNPIQKSIQLRRETLQLALDSNNGHIASAFSIIEILIAVYGIMTEQDRFILSKGHGCLSWYALLRQCGKNPTISGHPDIEPQEGICCTTGSLGHGLPIGVGMALAKKIKGEEGIVYVLMGDGECQEGTTWESSLLASRYGLNNLVVVIDRNGLQALGNTEKILPLYNLKNKFKAFGFMTWECIGHDVPQLQYWLQQKSPKPTVIIARTVKGKGLSFMENSPEWHSRLPEGELVQQAFAQLG